MTFNEFVGIKDVPDGDYVDIETGEPVSHSEKYRRAIVKLDGLNVIKAFIPFSIAEIKAALEKGDKYLNTLRLCSWDRAAGYQSYCNLCENISHGQWGIQRLMCDHHLTTYSCAEIVCLLKEAARWLAEEE